MKLLLSSSFIAAMACAALADDEKSQLHDDLTSAFLFSEDTAFWARTLQDTVASMSISMGSSDGRINACSQPLFEEIVPNALDPGFKYESDSDNAYDVEICKSTTQTGLVDEGGNKLSTPIYGYGDTGGCSWPGKTFEVQSLEEVTVRWRNNLPIEEYLITSFDGDSVVDTSVHWAYSLEGYDQYSIAENGTPVVPHIHGGHTNFAFDGNPEFFFSPGFEIKGPQWVAEDYVYDDSQHALTSWYHDHALGLTRLNVYAGMAGFYIVRDDQDTGKPDNPLNLPAFPYEAAFAIQDHMFKKNGEHFYPAFPGDPFYEDFIDGEGAELPEDQFPNGGPTVLAEFFGDVMLVNGVIWPKMEVEPRNYRLRLLNGCDSRFLLVEFYEVKLGETELPENGDPIPFIVVADDQGLAFEPETKTVLMVEPGSRYDVVFDFAEYDGSRVIMKNIGPDEPFSGDDDDFDSPRDGTFCYTDRIMAFDIIKELDDSVPDNFDPDLISSSADIPEPDRTRSVALFEGLDEFGRLEPLLGTVYPATDENGDPILFPDTAAHMLAGLSGKPIEGSVGWHEPTTEVIKLDTTEEWEIWNLSGDAHPMHLHLVFFEVVGRYEVVWDSATNDDDHVSDEDNAVGDGTFLVSRPLVQHNGALGEGFRVANPTIGEPIDIPDWYFENGPKDTVVAMPGTVTKIKATFDRAGRYVWHCHILSHEDDEMMRVFQVVP